MRRENTPSTHTDKQTSRQTDRQTHTHTYNVYAETETEATVKCRDVPSEKFEYSPVH